jgi:EmrB/QacA subfamily drug resistance transporter
VSRRETLVAFSGIMLAVLLAALDYTIVATALPTIVGDLRGFEQLSWVVTSYLVASTITIPLYGKLSDIYGRRTLLLVSVSIFLLGSTLCGFATSMTGLIAFRAIQGLGAGGLIPLAQAAVADLFSARERARYTGLLGSVWAAAAIAGPLVGGTLTDTISWRWIFFVNAPLCIVVIGTLVRTMPRIAAVAAAPRRIDWTGALVLSLSVSAVLLAAVWGGVVYPWASAEVVGTAVGGALLLVAFVLLERRTADPLLPLRLFRDPMVAALTSASFALGGVLFGVAIYVPLFAQGVLGRSATGAGVVLLPHLIGWVISAAVAGQVISRTGSYRALPAAGCAAMVAGIVALLSAGAGSSSLAVAGSVGVIGIGAGLTIQTITIAVQNAVPPQDIGVVTGLVFFARFMGGSVAVAGLGALLTNRFATHLVEHLAASASRVDRDGLLHGGLAVPPGLETGTRLALAESVHAVFFAFLPLALLGLLLTLRLPERPLGDQPVVVEPA